MALCAFILGSCVTAPRDVDGSPPPDFAEIRHLVDVCRSVYFDEPPAIRARWGAYYDDLHVVDLGESEDRYLIGTTEAPARQEIVIRPSANLVNAVNDADIRLRRDVRLGVLLHAGFHRGALHIYRDVIRRLRPGFDIVLYGHSLGGAEAAIVAAFLKADGWRVAQVYTSGQPRFTDGPGAARLSDVPLLRVVNDGDLVPYLPPRLRYTSFGRVIVLLDGPFYCLMSGVEADAAMAAGYQVTFANDDVSREQRSHALRGYLDRLSGKVDNAVQVPFADRERYLFTAPREERRGPRSRRKGSVPRAGPGRRENPP